MKKLLLATAAMLLTGSAVLAADMPVKVPYTHGFDWTSCYAGVHIGSGWASKDLTDPVQLAQDQVSGGPITAGVTTVGLRPSGHLYGGQFGCDYQFAGSGWVVGFEGSASGATINSGSFATLPQGDPGDRALVSTNVDFIISGTARVGYAWDRLLLYVKGGVAGVTDKYSVVGTLFAQNLNGPASPFNFQGLDLRIGWTAGGGVEWAIWENWSAKLEYDFYGFGNKSVLMIDSNFGSAPIGIKQTFQTVKLGLNFHMWSGSDW
jgi:outer membrane immunogenic protein